MPAKAEDILSGFRVNWMNLRDADTGKILWQVNTTLMTNIMPSYLPFQYFTLFCYIAGQRGPQYT